MALPDGPGCQPTASAPSGSSQSGIPNAAVTELAGEHVTLFSVRNGWEWASIFVRPCVGGAEVVAHSTFGTFGYIWGYMGEDWRSFLISCSREYAMRKMAGSRYEVPLGRDEFRAAMRAQVDEEERNILEAWGIVDSDQERRLNACRETLDDEWAWEDVPVEALFWHFDQAASGAPYAMELYETRMTKVNPQVIGFWDEIWKPFTANLTQGIEARRAETGTGSVHESPVGNADAPNPTQEPTP